MSVVEILGWVGSAEILMAFAMISFQKTTSGSILFQLLNLTGGIFLIINSLTHEAYPFTLINAVWVAISGVAVVNILRGKTKAS